MGIAYCRPAGGLKVEGGRRNGRAEFECTSAYFPLNLLIFEEKLR